MAKTMLVISILVGAGACQSAPNQTSGPAVVPTSAGPEPTEPPTTLPAPTTTTSVAPEPVEEAPVTTRTTRARSAPTTTGYEPPSPQSRTTGAAPLACIRRYEQGAAGYATDTGNGFYGAYQFDLATWQSVGGSGNPAHAAPSEQDSRAWRLYLRDGLDPWPTPAVKCRHLVA